MQWSKLKSRIESFICPELKNRIDFHLTGYRKSHDGADKVWVLVDGEKVFSFKYYAFEFAEREAYYDLQMSESEAKERLWKNEIHSPKNFGDAAREYLNLSLKEALESPNDIVKAFAVIDKRVGKGTLAKLEIPDSAHTLVKIFYRLRAESWKEK
jgi:hypothetical protein